MERDRGCEPREGWQLALQWGRRGRGGEVEGAGAQRLGFYLLPQGDQRGTLAPKLKDPVSGPYTTPPHLETGRCPLLSQDLGIHPQRAAKLSGIWAAWPRRQQPRGQVWREPGLDRPRRPA